MLEKGRTEAIRAGDIESVKTSKKPPKMLVELRPGYAPALSFHDSLKCIQSPSRFQIRPKSTDNKKNRKYNEHRIIQEADKTKSIMNDLLI